MLCIRRVLASLWHKILRMGVHGIKDMMRIDISEWDYAIRFAKIT
jgi:hypothetical protein